MTTTIKDLPTTNLVVSLLAGTTEPVFVVQSGSTPVGYRFSNTGTTIVYWTEGSSIGQKTGATLTISPGETRTVNYQQGMWVGSLFSDNATTVLLTVTTVFLGDAPSLPPVGSTSDFSDQFYVPGVNVLQGPTTGYNPPQLPTSLPVTPQAFTIGPFNVSQFSHSAVVFEPSGPGKIRIEFLWWADQARTRALGSKAFHLDASLNPVLPWSVLNLGPWMTVRSIAAAASISGAMFLYEINIPYGERPVPRLNDIGAYTDIGAYNGLIAFSSGTITDGGAATVVNINPYSGPAKFYLEAENSGAGNPPAGAFVGHLVSSSFDGSFSQLMANLVANIVGQNSGIITGIYDVNLPSLINQVQLFFRAGAGLAYAYNFAIVVPNQE